MALLRKFTFSIGTLLVAGSPLSIFARSATQACFCVATVLEMR